MPHILFTGGGSAGHVTPNIALIEYAQEQHWRVSYIGSRHGIERRMIEPLDVPFYRVVTGKLRRYFSWANFIDPFRIVAGFLQSLMLCLKLQPDLVFSKGGFVSVPVVIAAWVLRIPVISHESDVTPGLANRIAYPFCQKICVTFDATLTSLPDDRVVVTGTPVRRALLEGDAGRGLAWLGMVEPERDKPLLLVLGGSLGARVINKQIRALLDELLADFNVVHVTGAGQLDPGLSRAGYEQREFIGDEFGDVLAAASLVVSRAGANTVYEMLVTRKPHLLIPLGRDASRGDQMDNAKTFSDAGYSTVIQEDALSDDVFLEAVRGLHRRADEVARKLAGFEKRDSVALLFAEIQRSFK